MMHPTRAGIGLVRLGDSSFVLGNPEDELRGREVCDPHGQRIGSVEDLLVDSQEREVRFLDVRDGGFLGILVVGEKRFLVPVEAVTRVTGDRVTIEPGRTGKADGPAPFNPKLKPPPADDQGDDQGGDHASPPFGNAEGTADPRGAIHALLPFGRR